MIEKNVPSSKTYGVTSFKMQFRQIIVARTTPAEETDGGATKTNVNRITYSFDRG